MGLAFAAVHASVRRVVLNGKDGAVENTANKEVEPLMLWKYGDDWRTSGDSKLRALRNGERSKVRKWLKRDKGMK